MTMRAALRCWLLLALCHASAACALFTGEEEPALRQLPVVDDRGEFDPSQAVDDDDDLERSVSRANDAQAEDAFADRSAPDAPPPRRAGADLPSSEHVANPAEVQQLLVRRQRDVEAAARAPREDEDSKVELAWNPPAEGIGPEPSIGWTVADYLLEGLLLTVAAAGLSGCFLLVRSHPRSTLAVGLLGAIAIGGFVWSQFA